MRIYTRARICYNIYMKHKGTISAARYMAVDRLTRFISPAGAVCVFCGGEADGCGVVCEKCRSRLTENAGRVCKKCGRVLIAEEEYCETCRNHSRVFDLARSRYVYEDGARKIITDYKYGKALYLAKVIAHDMAEVYAAADMNCTVMINAPATPARVKERGFDHTALLCEYLSAELHIPFAADAIVKKKDNSAQAGLSGAEREENVQGAYGRGENAKRLRGAHVLIVDDVLTTGATASAVAREAYKCRAAGVKVLTYASTRSVNILSGGEI